MNYYNEFDPKAAAWLRELIKAGLIPNGKVDERSITDVCAGDLHGFTQCHFFAGIGGWPYALSLAGWSEDRPVWTGSCPCQPFSNAGKRKGFSDERHVWPIWFNLIRQCRPSVIFGEQVASKDALPWLDGVFGDLEGENYACAAADLCAAGVGAPHIRQRLFWVADTKENGRSGYNKERGCVVKGSEDSGKLKPTRIYREGAFLEILGCCGCGGHTIAASELGNTICKGLEEREIESHGQESHGQEFQATERASGELDFWSDAIWHECRDGKSRRISPKPALFPLAHGIPGRVGMLRGAGNAIVPQVAAEFLKAYLETLTQT